MKTILRRLYDTYNIIFFKCTMYCCFIVIFILKQQLEKEKAEREKEKAANSSISVGSLGSWSQGLTWATNLSSPAWQSAGNKFYSFDH